MTHQTSPLPASDAALLRALAEADALGLCPVTASQLYGHRLIQAPPHRPITFWLKIGALVDAGLVDRTKIPGGFLRYALTDAGRNNL
jgi:hypothetical protein